MENSNVIIIIPLVLSIVGIATIILTLTLGRGLREKPVDLEIKPLGIRIETDASTLLIIVGIVIALSGTWFTYKGYVVQETKLKAEMDTLKHVVEKLKGYTYCFNLIFPDPDDINLPETIVQAYVTKSGEIEPVLIEMKPMVDLKKSAWVKMFGHNIGDELRFVVIDDKKREWEGEYIIKVPEIKLEMRQKE